MNDAANSISAQVRFYIPPKKLKNLSGFVWIWAKKLLFFLWLLICYRFKSSLMPLYMDLHRGLIGVKREDAERAHHLDEQVQDKYGVKYHKFWLNEETGTI